MTRIPRLNVALRIPPPEKASPIKLLAGSRVFSLASSRSTRLLRICCSSLCRTSLTVIRAAFSFTFFFGLVESQICTYPLCPDFDRSATAGLGGIAHLRRRKSYHQPVAIRRTKPRARVPAGPSLIAPVISDVDVVKCCLHGSRVEQRVKVADGVRGLLV